MTAREQQILALIREDPMISQQAIAERLGITRSSVAGHIMKLTNKGAIKGRGYLVSDGPFVAVIGGANMDIHGNPAASLHLQDSNPGTVRIAAGGVARNIAENLARLGVNCRLISAVGDDRHGRQLIREGRVAGIDMQHVLRISDAQTSTYMSILDAGGDMHVAINDMAIMDELGPDRLRPHEAMLRQASLIVLDTNLPVDSLSWLTDTFSEQVLFVDTSSAAKAEKILPLLRSVHTLKSSQLEAEALTGMKSNTESRLGKLASRLHERGVSRVFITLGELGVFYSADSQQGIEKPRRGQGAMRNSGGAGDAFMAGIAYAWLEAWPLMKSVHFGNAAANVTLQHSAASSPALSLATVARAVGEPHVS